VLVVKCSILFSGRTVYETGFICGRCIASRWVVLAHGWLLDWPGFTYFRCLYCVLQPILADPADGAALVKEETSSLFVLQLPTDLQ
jgi:hypothetical protein